MTPRDVYIPSLFLTFVSLLFKSIFGNNFPQICSTNKTCVDQQIVLVMIWIYWTEWLILQYLYCTQLRWKPFKNVGPTVRHLSTAVLWASELGLIKDSSCFSIYHGRGCDYGCDYHAPTGPDSAFYKNNRSSDPASIIWALNMHLLLRAFVFVCLSDHVLSVNNSTGSVRDSVTRYY